MGAIIFHYSTVNALFRSKLLMVLSNKKSLPLPDTGRKRRN